MISGGPTDGDSNRARKTSSKKLLNIEISGQVIHPGLTLYFWPEDMKGVISNHNDSLVIRAMVANYDLARIFVDLGSSVNVLFQEAINQMDLGQYKMEPVVTSQFGFTGHTIRPVGRPAMNTFMVVESSLHQKIKFPVGNEVGKVQGDRVIARKCYVEEVRIEQKVTKTDNVSRPGLFGMEQVKLIEDTSVTAEEEVEEIMISPPSGMVKVARTLEAQLNKPLIECLKTKKYVFAWSVADLVGVRREVAEHKLNVVKDCRPIIQKKCHFGHEKDAVIKEQVEKLLRAGHIEEIHFPTWLSNIVLVPKSTGKWRIFLDAYQGYHLIPLAKEDKDKVSFVTLTGIYCYVVMPFGLKNDGDTYQRLMDKVFKQQIGNNIEVYVDDILVKTRTADQFITDLTQTFQTLKNYQLKLNPNK
ncbi:uncharacterized protein [Henckelia pumila]|uniref:uncharacterized protein n=1 Tax=Henckelia pumila TaxID=405737 RepID=UPI003C6E1EC1